MRQKKRRTVKPPKTKKPYWKLVPLAIAALGVAALMYPKSSPEQNARPPAIERRVEKAPEKLNLKLPPAKVSLTKEPLAEGHERFEEADQIIESGLERRGAKQCPYSFGSMDDYPAFLNESRNKLGKAGINIAAGAETPREIFDALQKYYKENNFWIAVRRATVIKGGELLGEIGCIFRFPIEEKMKLSYSYFNGKIAHSDIPILLLGGDGIPEQGQMAAGFTLKSGIVAFPDQSEHISCSRENLIRDLSIHEGIHYLTMGLEDDWGTDEFDFDANAKTTEPPEKTRARQRDEVRAYLIQAMYGKCPSNAFEMMWRAPFTQYSLTKEAIWDSMDHVLSFNPGLNRLYQAGMLHLGMVPEKELRIIAYDAFLKNGLFYRSD